MRLTAALFAAALPGLAAAQPLGVAIVQAPEQSWGFAAAPTLPQAVDLAIGACVRGGAPAEDCLVTNWCFPAGWTITLAVMHVEGLHWSESYCGLPERDLALRQAELLCDTQARPWISMCDLVALHDPEGTALEDW